MLALALITLASLAFIAVLALRAPMGWQDTAFHLGEEPFVPPAVRFERGFDAVEGGSNSRPAGSLSLHGSEIRRG